MEKVDKIEWYHELPEKSGTYLVTIKHERKYGAFIINDVVYYDVENNFWKRYDPFRG